MDPESDDDDDSGEPITKVEDESDESEGDDHEPPFVDVPSTSADDQPGPSGVGKDGVEAPCTRSKVKLLKTEKKLNRIAKQVVKQKPNRRCISEADPDFIIKEKNCPAELNPPKHKPDLDYLDNFINLNQLTEPLECKDCKLTFHSNIDFGLHSKHHTEDGFYSCHMCEYRKDSKKLIKNHIRRHDTFKCKKCKKIFISRQCAYKHSKSHLPQAPVKCEVCSKTFNNPKYLKRHHQVVHSEDTIDTVPIFFKCTKCNKQYKHAAGLKGHCSSNHRELGIDTSVICDICGKRLSCNAKLKQHLRIHTGDKPFPCTVCPRKFISKDILRAHMRVHTGEKPYVCMYCGKKFSHGAPYRYHIKTHTGEKSWSCPICAKGFISKANMKIHLKTCAVPSK